MNVQLVIPMSGLGSRFARAGYSDPKPLIKVHGHAMIEWVLRMFPGVDAPLFICRNAHLESTAMRDILMQAKPSGQIKGIEGSKTGPVAALMQTEAEIDDDAPVLVSYCDYYMHWDFAEFLAYAERENLDGAVPCYTGFHPHLLPEANLYASCRADSEGMMLEIREKFSFEADKEKALHSPGAYYFRSGRIMKKYCRALMASGETLGGEYYASLVYPQMVADGLRVGVPANVEKFCQWGTPQDLEDHLYWIGTISKAKP